MKAFAVSTLTIIMAMLAASAAAQTNTDEARALAAQATAERQREDWTRPPVAEPVVADYRAQAHERVRMLQWQAAQRDVRGYAAGARSQPLAVNSEDSARAEARRLHAEQSLAERAAMLRSAAAAQ